MTINYDEIQVTLQHELGTKEYMKNILQIANVMSKIDNIPYAEGLEELIADIVIDYIRGTRRYLGKKDILDSKMTRSLDYLIQLLDSDDPVVSNETTIQAERIQDFQELGPVRKNAVNQRSIGEKLERLDWIEEQIREQKKPLVKIQIGKQTANDWLSDLVGKEKDGDKRYLLNRVKEIRELSQQTFKKGTVTDKIRAMVSLEELKKDSTETICKKYGLDYDSGSIRKIISRLRAASA